MDSEDNLNNKQRTESWELTKINELPMFSNSDHHNYLKVIFLKNEFYNRNDFSMEATIGYTKDHKIIYWGMEAEKLFGYTKEEVLGMNVGLLLPKHELSEINNFIEAFEKCELIKSYQSQRKHKNGSLIQLGITVTPIYNDNKEFFGVFVQYRDISEKKKILEQRTSADEIWRFAIHGGKFEVWEWYIDLGILRFHNNWYNVFETHATNVELLVDDWLRSVHTEDIPNLLDMLTSALQGTEYVSEFRMLAKDGQYIWVRGKGKVTEWDDKGRPLKMIGTNEDITDRKLIEEQLAEKCRQLEVSQKEAERENQAKTKFLSGISHEIRTPMNGIVGILQLLKKSKLDQKQTKWVNMLQESINSQMSIINNMLDITTIESGKIELENSLFNVKLLTTEIYDQLRILCRPKRLEAKLDFDRQIQHMVYGDKLRVKQILLNLINNAVKFTDHGSITLEVSLRNSDENTEDIEFRIIDTGIGISLQDRDKIFESYYQGDISSKKKHMGTGLGLTISKQLALLMDGDIKVESEPDVGSAFQFNLKLSKYKKSAIPKEEKYNQEQSEIQHDQTYPSHNRNKVRDEILLSVEDNEINQEIIEAVVKGSGLHLLTAGSGEEAIVLIEKYQVDLILMDIQMPGMTGYELTRIIRQKDRFKDIPIIAMTAYAMEEERSRCLEAGMNDYIAKPINIKELDRVLGKYVDQNNESSELA
jgi:PAS domain S-box-containing protein